MTIKVEKYMRAALLALLLSSPALAEQKTEYIYLPPEWAKNVVFYHSFEKGVDKPEVNLIDVAVQGEKANLVQGLTGRGYKSANTNEAGRKAQALRITGPGVAVNHPITVMCWFRLDAPMKPESCFELLQLYGKDGWIASFVRGKGEWCGLKEPTRITQVHNFPGVSNHNNPWGGPVSFKAGDWHHVAITVANASKVSVYWDGELKETVSIKGRDFKAEDVFWAQFDSNPFFYPTSVDEVVVANVVLTAQQIADYVKAVQALTTVRFPSTEVGLASPELKAPAQ